MKRWAAAGLMMLAVCTAACAGAQPAVITGAETAVYADAVSDGEMTGVLYAGAPVDVTAEAGDRVRIAVGTVLEGYVSGTKVAPQGEDRCPMRTVVSPYGTQSVVVRSKPSNSYHAVAMLTVGEKVRVIGMCTRDYYLIMLSDGQVGCLGAEELN